MLKPDLIETLRTPGRLNDGTLLGYGMGLMIDTDRGLARTQHGGAWAGYRAVTVQYPQQRPGFVPLEQRDAKGRVQGLEYSSERVKGLRYVRG
ncbi:hypothetical protein [Inhella sp.]|uniref:hypothetical protein n=1 Tax=Inhella sp. TaxID=1921806 RepID=UPI0035B17821